VQAVGSEVSEEPDPYKDGSRVHPGRFLPKTGERAAEPEAKDEEGSSLGMTLAASVWRRLWQAATVASYTP